MYKLTMHADVVTVRDVYLQGAPCTVNPLWCAYCVLDRWEHVGLSSPYWRWYWNDRPGASIGFDTGRLHLDPGHVVLVPPNTVFTTHTGNRVGHFHYHFWLNTRPARNSARPTRLAIRATEQARLRFLVRRLARDGQAPREPGASLSILSMVAAALSQADYDWDVQTHDPLIDRVRQRLYAAASSRQLDNLTLARDTGVSVNTLLRRFQRATGMSPRQFLLQLRVEKGAELLRSSDRSIPEIAEMCGFVDRYHFTRTFSARAGASPAVFRDNHRRNTSPDRPGEMPRAD